ncbi:proteoglycan 4 isoform X6 [Octodon degus]|uniref:Proteoglycan 4 isoform X6 n=1 Tax=Octodon degus TaxID=10160 RepID=A0A6P6DIJ8_OCTDE|nr:proteoglycan 4 isoform X6 [Octodon degus]
MEWKILPVFLLLLLSVFLVQQVSSQDLSSCAGRCGEGYSRDATCNCDYSCQHYMECCPDFKKVCTTELSCKGRCFESFSRGRECDCDAHCAKYGKCCPDYESFCAEVHNPTSPPPKTAPPPPRASQTIKSTTKRSPKSPKKKKTKKVVESEEITEEHSVSENQESSSSSSSSSTIRKIKSSKNSAANRELQKKPKVKDNKKKTPKKEPNAEPPAVDETGSGQDSGDPKLTPAPDTTTQRNKVTTTPKSTTAKPTTPKPSLPSNPDTSKDTPSSVNEELTVETKESTETNKETSANAKEKTSTKATRSSEKTSAKESEPTPEVPAKPTPKAETTTKASAVTTPKTPKETPTTSKEVVPTTEKSVPTTTKDPAPTTPKKPAPTTTKEPAPTTPKEPAPTTTKEPAPTTPKEPAPTTTKKPAPTTTKEPAPTSPKEPVPTTAKESAPTTPEEPSPTTSKKPVPTTPEEPAPTTHKTLAPTTTMKPPTTPKIPAEATPEFPSEPTPEAPNESPKEPALPSTKTAAMTTAAQDKTTKNEMHPTPEMDALKITTKETETIAEGKTESKTTSTIMQVTSTTPDTTSFKIITLKPKVTITTEETMNKPEETTAGPKDTPNSKATTPKPQKPTKTPKKPSTKTPKKTPKKPASTKKPSTPKVKKPKTTPTPPKTTPMSEANPTSLAKFMTSTVPNQMPNSKIVEGNPNHEDAAGTEGERPHVILRPPVLTPIIIPGTDHLGRLPNQGISIDSMLSDETNLCNGKPIDGLTTLYNGTLVAFRGHYFWMLNPFSPPSPARRITEVWGIPSPIDTVFTRCNCEGKTFFFKDSQYWRFTNDKKDPGYPKLIVKGFGGLSGKVVAALSIAKYKNRPESVYFFKRGGNIQQYTYKQEPTRKCTGRRPVINYSVYGEAAQVRRRRFERAVGPYQMHTIRIHYSPVRDAYQDKGFLHNEVKMSTMWRGFPNVVTSAITLPNIRKPDGYDYYAFSNDQYYNIDVPTRTARAITTRSGQTLSKVWYNCP